MSDGDNGRPWDEIVILAALSAVPSIGGVLQLLAEKAMARDHRIAREFVADVVEDTTAETLARRMEDSPEVESVFLRAAAEAVRTPIEAKRALLAQVVCAAVLDDAKVDMAQLYVQALEDIDAPHLRALERLRRISEEGRATTDRGEPEQAFLSAWRAEPLPVRAVLVRTGCAEPWSPTYLDVAGGWLDAAMVTDFGRELLDWVRGYDVNRQVTG